MRLDDDIEVFLDKVQVPVTLADATAPDMPLVATNDRFCALTGYARSEMVGTNCRFLQGEDRDQPARADIREAVRAGRSLQCLLRNYRKDGSAFQNLLFLYPIGRVGGEPRFYLGSQFEVPAEDEMPRVQRHLDDLEHNLDVLLHQTLVARANTRRWLSDAVRNTLHAKLAAKGGAGPRPPGP